MFHFFEKSYSSEIPRAYNNSEICFMPAKLYCMEKSTHSRTHFACAEQSNKAIKKAPIIHGN